jgi:excisionase family DNA binding protein
MREHIEALERTVSSAAVADLPALLGELERLKVLAWHRTMGSQGPARHEAPARFSDRLTITTAEVAEWIGGVDEDHVQALCRSGAIRASKPGKAWLIRPAAIEEWLSQQEGDQQAQRGRPALASAPSRGQVRLDALPENRRRTA